MTPPLRLLSRSMPRGFLCVATLLLVAACATQPVGPPIHSDFDHSVNFANYKTFGFPENPGTDRGGYTTLVTTHFKDAVKREMTARGYVYADSSPDLIVNFYHELKDRTRVYSYPYPAWGGWGYWGYPYGFGYPHPYRYGYGGFYGYGYGRPYYGFYSAWPFYFDQGVDVVQYKSGTIKLDLVDAARKQVVWEANVEEPLTETALDDPQPTIARLIMELFKRFPIANSLQSSLSTNTAPSKVVFLRDGERTDAPM